MNKVKITTFIPVYNMADTVERAILSVLNQDYENKELIVLDGGSTDGTVEVVKKYLDRIAYFASGPDGGSSKAIATNLCHATGEIVGMIGADDWYNPGALSAVAKTYEETHADVVFGDVTVRDPERGERFVCHKNMDLDKLYAYCAVFTIAAYVKKELLAEHYEHYFQNHEGKLKIATDHYLWLRLYRAGRRFAYIESDGALTSFSMTGVSCSHPYQTLTEINTVLELAVGPRGPETEPYYQAYERRFATYSVPFYQKVIGNDRLSKVIASVTDGQKDFILFGAGDIGQQFAGLLQGCGYRIRYVADNYPERSGGFCMGIPVRSPDALLAERDVILLISTVNYADEIYQQIQGMDLDPSVTVMTHADFGVKIYEALGKAVLDEGWKNGIIQ